jgi:hypothetical protein
MDAASYASTSSKPKAGNTGRIPPGSELNPRLQPYSNSRSAIASAAREPVEFLRMKSSEYELVAGWPAERPRVNDQHLAAPQAILVVGIARQEVAETIDARWEARHGAAGRSAAPCSWRPAYGP